MSEERRRYFRINETVGIAYEILEPGEHEHTGRPAREHLATILDEIETLDAEIDHELAVVAEDSPAVARLISLFNQKLERVVGHLTVDSALVTRLAHKLKEANISACGISFANDEAVPEGTNLRMELTLYPSEKNLQTNGRVIACESAADDSYYWRVDFFGMSKANQEALIQHIVRSQSMQLQNKLKV